MIIYKALVAVALMALVAGEEPERFVVTTQHGKISGIKEHSTNRNSFYSYHAIPYAKPPVGSLRFKDPVPHEGWKDVRDGAIMPPVCAQMPWFAVVHKEPVFDGDEDCLYLSVFTNKPGEVDAQLPVMVFIHGGAYFAGGINWYRPYVLLNHEIVLVIIQYRLGILGFMSTEDDIIPGNFGMKDQTLALQWIQDNIHNFGGDRSRVTIFGESAGGASVHYHILSPYSEGLFSRGILQSGTLFSPWAMGGAFREVAKYTGNQYKCPSPKMPYDDDDSLALLTCLQKVDAKDLTLGMLDHFKMNFNPVLFGPRVDGDYLPDEPELLMTRGQHKNLSIISGVTTHEGGLFAFPLYESEKMQSDLLNNFQEIGPASMDMIEGDAFPVELTKMMFEYYVGEVRVDHEDADDICQLYGDRHFTVGHDQTAILHARNFSPHSKTFLYELTHRGQRSFGDFSKTTVGKHWVSHVDDLFYQFTGENSLWKALEREEDLKLRNIITTLWTNFAATGNPTPDDSLGFIWDPSTEDHLHHLALKPEPSMEEDHRQEVRSFWESLPTRQNYLLHPEKVVPVTASPVPEVGKEKRIHHTAGEGVKKYTPHEEL